MVPENAPIGECTVPATVDAEAVGTKLTTSGYVTFTVVKPPPSISPVPDYMTYVFAFLLLALIAYAYFKR